jgi:hypothetical protein
VSTGQWEVKRYRATHMATDPYQIHHLDVIHPNVPFSQSYMYGYTLGDVMEVTMLRDGLGRIFFLDEDGKLKIVLDL